MQSRVPLSYFFTIPNPELQKSQFPDPENPIGDPHRTQRSYLNGVLSIEQCVSCGNPQGSILEPFLFIIYVEDFPKCLQHTTPGMFADDMYISTLECSLNSDLAAVHDWLKTNNLSCNTSKTCYMTRQKLNS